MLTLREAKQRLAVHSMQLSRVGASDQFRVSYPEDSWRDSEKHAYYTDCLLDAAITGADMRKQRGLKRA
ncbi:hypothetical protein CPT_Palo_010 [Rhizobium phage Palo]|uniref:Uncharacterized protein n=1 Tax=Rhizobium phage Palo TaxID=2767573 RepID=A0A7L8G5Z6_9CAUD|nr:hypothetical protein CPT_Palo_010 [Rhizobium phage Palo]